MLLNLSDVLSDRHQTINETVQLDMEEFQMRAGTYSIVQKDPVMITVSHMKKREYRIQAKSKICVLIPCDRCLEDVEQEIVLDVEKHVDLAQSDAELEEGFDESNYIDGYYLDVDKMLYNEILIGWPTKVLCREDCKGICNVCGQNLNKGTCDCEDTSLDPRMSVVRDLFKNATENAPCIIFIDEIDAIGRSRDSRMGGNDEREQTLNQLLSEMDGFDSTKGLLVLGATNRPEVLDPALLRPGRFDRRVVVDKPDLNGRINILKVHSKDVLLDESVDFKEIALATSGAVGADLANMMNEAAINAVKHGRNAVSQKDLFEAVEVVLVGKEKKDRIMSKEERRIVSYHEVGHALVSALQKHSEPVQKITIVPRTMGALGYVMNVPEEEKYLNTKKELEARLVELMAGRAAEEIVFETVTTGAANDIQQATNLARAMVTQYGMSDKFGLMGLESQENQYLTGRAVLNCGDATAAEIDQEVMKILKDSYDEAIRLLSDNKDAMDQIAAFLIDKETITGKEFMKIFRRVKGIPEPEEPKEDDDKGTASQELHANPETQADRGERENQAEQANPQEQVNPEEQANPQTQSNPGNQSGPEVSDRGNEPEKKTEDTVWSHPGNDRNL